MIFFSLCLNEMINRFCLFFQYIQESIQEYKSMTIKNKFIKTWLEEKEKQEIYHTLNDDHLKNLVSFHSMILWLVKPSGNFNRLCLFWFIQWFKKGKKGIKEFYKHNLQRINKSIKSINKIHLLFVQLFYIYYVCETVLSCLVFFKIKEQKSFGIILLLSINQSVLIIFISKTNNQWYICMFGFNNVKN